MFGIGGCEEVYEFHILGAATRKARAPNERLCRGTESKWLADERVDLEGLWYWKIQKYPTKPPHTVIFYFALYIIVLILYSTVLYLHIPLLTSRKCEMNVIVIVNKKAII